MLVEFETTDGRLLVLHPDNILGIQQGENPATSKVYVIGDDPDHYFSIVGAYAFHIDKWQDALESLRGI